MQTDIDPAFEYNRRLDQRKAATVRLARRDRMLGNLKLALIACIFAAIYYAVFVTDFALTPVILIPLLPFIALSVSHDRVITALQDANRAIEFYKSGLRRLNGTWQGTGVWGQDFRQKNHPYCDDLDLFGRASLFEYLCAARTGIGQWTLAKWLLSPDAPEDIRGRQGAVAELAPKLDFREAMAVLGQDLPSAARLHMLESWASDPPVQFPDWIRPFALVLAVANMTGGVLWAAGFGPAVFFIAGALSSICLWTLGTKPGKSLRSAIQPARDLRRMGGLLNAIESQAFESALLRGLGWTVSVSHGDSTASQRIDQLEKWIYLNDSMSNILFAPIGAMLLIPLHAALGIERWKQNHGSQVHGWIDALGRIEALCSLGGFRFEHPNDVFPEIVDGGDACFDARALAHPLIDESTAIANDVSIGAPSRLLIVSGSNMSGKSTLLRSVGANAVLAFAGAPVRASGLRISRMAIGASIRTLDSLESGVSRFYAEILRLRQIVDMTAESIPVLFLLDEILHGTNSHDRRIGAEAVLRSLVSSGAIGLATTHDLALAQIADSPESRAVNVHFEDQLEDDKMAFDYKLRSGTVKHSNALALMRSIGLDV